MYIIPAIDLRDGRCVRLIQGEYHRQITYRDDPVGQAEDFISSGAEWLHIVDLDGAKLGKIVNMDSIAAIAALREIRIEVGGGIREESTIAKLLDMGIERVIIGTKAVSDFEWFKQITKKFSGRIVLSIDARESKVATEGWTKDNPQTLLEFAVQAAELPLAAIIYTDITRDGMMSGPNLKRTKTLLEAIKIPVITAGGINKISDIKKLAQLGVEAVIIGRALYEGNLDLAKAIKAARHE